MKKLLLIALACALLLSASACKGKNEDKKKDTTKTTEQKFEVVTDANGTPMTDADGETITVPVEVDTPEDITTDNTDTATDTDAPVDTEIEGTVIDPIEPSPEDDETNGNIGGGYYVTDEEGNESFVEDTMPEQVELNPGGENVSWPTELPTDIPQLTGYASMDRVTYEDYGAYDFWSTGFNLTSDQYDAYKAVLGENGFTESSEVFALWGKTNVTVDISPEYDGDNVWMNFEITKVKDLSIPADFFAFETDYIRGFAEKDDGYICVGYECGTDFDADADAYLETLAANGFTVNGDVATKGNYTCTVDREYRTLTYEF